MKSKDGAVVVTANSEASTGLGMKINLANQVRSECLEVKHVSKEGEGDDAAGWWSTGVWATLLMQCSRDSRLTYRTHDVGHISERSMRYRRRASTICRG